MHSTGNRYGTRYVVMKKETKRSCEIAHLLKTRPPKLGVMLSIVMSRPRFLRGVCCLHIKSSFLPSVISTPSARPDS